MMRSARRPARTRRRAGMPPRYPTAADHLGGHSLDGRRHSFRAQRRSSPSGPGAAASPVARTGSRHTSRRRAVPGPGIPSTMSSACAARLDIRAALARPVERHVLGDGFPSLGDGDRADGAAETNGTGRRAATSSTRRRLSTLVSKAATGRAGRRGVDHAVEHHIAVGHRCAQGLFVAQVAVAAFDVEVVDRDRRAGLAKINPDIVATLDELAGDVGADEPARPHHEEPCGDARCSLMLTLASSRERAQSRENVGVLAR